MNAITFGTKRAFQGFLRVTRKRLAELGLTAARFDLLSAIVACKTNWWAAASGVRQSEVRKMLGVTAPVVTRMVRALVKLGLVERWREVYFGDRRQVRLGLTKAGERCIRKATRVMVPEVKRTVYRAICFGKHRSVNARFRHMAKLEGYLRALRGRFRDRARLYYAWGHPDD